MQQRLELVVSDQQESWMVTVLQNLRDAITRGAPIRLPDFQRDCRQVGSEFALLSVGAEPNAYGGTMGEYRYQFEGEEDLLHVFVVRQDLEPFPCETAQAIIQRLLPNVPPAFIYLRPGERSHHFYLGHDWLLH